MAHKRYEYVDYIDYHFFERLLKRQDEGLMPKLLRLKRKRNFFYSFVLVEFLASITIKIIRS